MRYSSLPLPLSLTRNVNQKIWKSKVGLSHRRHAYSDEHYEYMVKARERIEDARRPMRTRFAPSPTGKLHLGSLRTALFNYLIAKATGGKFILRIEDTDSDRTRDGAEESIYEDLKWAGIQWDEGPIVGGKYGPYRQSERKDLYAHWGQQLIDSGHGYRCFCSKKHLHDRAKHYSDLGLPQFYDRTCAPIPKEQSDQWAEDGKPYVIRLKAPEHNAYPPFQDEVFGTIRMRPPGIESYAMPGSEGFEDPILIKSDGMPTYHFANVVDDHLMKITHVIRGSEWMSSTHKHVLLYKAFGWKPPKFAHVGLLLNEDRLKLSKRDGAVDIGSFRDQGYFPETVTNFLALLGWSHLNKNDVMGMERLIKYASMKYTRGDSVVNFGKLDFLQRQHAERYAYYIRHPYKPIEPYEDMVELAAKPILKLIRDSPDGNYEFFSSGPKEFKDSKGEILDPELNYITTIILADAKQYILPPDFLSRNRYFFQRPTSSALQTSIPNLKLHNIPINVIYEVPDDFASSFDMFQTVPAEKWTVDEIKAISEFIINEGAMLSISEFTEKSEWTEGAHEKIKKCWGRTVHRYLRWAIQAGTSGPDGATTMCILGREETLKRLELAKEVMDVHRSQEAAGRRENVESLASNFMGGKDARDGDGDGGDSLIGSKES